MAATLKDALGHTITASVSWSSEDQAVAAVSQSGVIAGIEAGTTNIVAASGGKTQKVGVTVQHGAESTVSVSAPQGSSIVEGATAQGGTPKSLIATVKDAKGHDLSVLPENLTWSSDKATVATVSAVGEVTGVIAGSATIKATSGAASGTGGCPPKGRRVARRCAG